jgi:hypothetical protein
LQEALERYAPKLAHVAVANPVIRANALMPSARYGMREEMKQAYGFAWRDHVRSVTTTFDASANLAFGVKEREVLAALDQRLASRIDPAYTLDPAKATQDRRIPGVIVAAANADGEIVRYFEAGETAAYFGSPYARDPETGFYDRRHESRMIASTGKIIAAIAIANTMRDTAGSLYVDRQAPAAGLETCRHGSERRGRAAIVAFACSLNDPLINRTALVGQARVAKLIDAFGFAMPPRNSLGEGTPPSTAAVLGLVGAAPRAVHRMAAVVLASLIGRGTKPVRAPTLIKAFGYTHPEGGNGTDPATLSAIVPDRVIRRGARPLLRTLLSAPLCYQSHGRSYGTLHALAAWCASRRAGLKLHFAKTGTQVTLDPDATVDAWITGGLQFANGAAYSYVVVVGTGAATAPWARKVHSGDVVPLLQALLEDLEADATGKKLPRAAQAKTSAPLARKSPAKLTAN